MSTTAERTAPGDVDRSVKQRTTELLRSNEALREDLRKAMREIAELTRRLNAAVMGGRADRESRRAALNLLEDAVGARHAEQRENLERQRARKSFAMPTVVKTNSWPRSRTNCATPWLLSAIACISFGSRALMAAARNISMR